jgi:hypothetical protein
VRQVDQENADHRAISRKDAPPGRIVNVETRVELGDPGAAGACGNRHAVAYEPWRMPLQHLECR